MPASSPIVSLRECRRLHSRKERQASGRFLVEGIRPVRAALMSPARIEVVLYVPESLRDGYGQETIDLARVRHAIRQGLKLRLRYRTDTGAETERLVWPVILGYAEASRLLVAWCELRQGFRHFRTRRIVSADVLEERYGVSTGTLRRRWQRWRRYRAVYRSSSHASKGAGRPNR